MNKIFVALAFHRDGKPRKWLIYLLFDDKMIARSLFRRIVHKRSGRVRPHFAPWVSQTSNLIGGDVNPGSSQRNVVEKLRPEEMSLQAMVPFEEAVKNWRHKRAPMNLMDANSLLDCLTHVLDQSDHRLIVSVSHDNYITVIGGVQLCIKREQALAMEMGLAYLQIHPWNPLPRMAHLSEDPDTTISMILNGLEIGTCKMTTLIEVVKLTTIKSQSLSVIVHQLLGHLPEQVAELVKISEPASCLFWLHDSFSLCPSVNLQRNNLVFCGAPPVTSNACTLCVYGKERIDHENRLEAFFAKLKVKVIAPSEVTAAFWLEKSRFQIESMSIKPHIELEISHREPVRRPQKLIEEKFFPIKIGFLGAAAPHKGWPLFTKLMSHYSGLKKYHFSVMSSQEPLAGEDAWVSVSVSIDNLNAMSDAVAENDIDLVVHWPTGRETFSYTTFEALVGSAYVVTNSGSGNVAAVVNDVGRGVVLNSEEDLLEFFRDGRAEDMVRTRRTSNQGVTIKARHGDLSLSFIVEDKVS